MPARAIAKSVADALPLGLHQEAVLTRIEGLERLLEGLFVIPGTNRKVGLDALLGLLPVAGDTITAVMGLYLVWEARNLGLPRWKLARMVGNVALDWAIGTPPVIGDALDFLFRSNTRNLKIIRKHLSLSPG